MVVRFGSGGDPHAPRWQTKFTDRGCFYHRGSRVGCQRDCRILGERSRNARRHLRAHLHPDGFADRRMTDFGKWSNISLRSFQPMPRPLLVYPSKSTPGSRPNPAGPQPCRTVSSWTVFGLEIRGHCPQLVEHRIVICHVTAICLLDADVDFLF